MDRHRSTQYSFTYPIVASWREACRTVPFITCAAGLLLSFLLSFIPHCARGAEVPSPVQQAFRAGTGDSIHVKLETEYESGIAILRAAGITRECTLCTGEILLNTARALGVDVYNHLHSTRAARLQLTHLSAENTMVWIDGFQLPQSISQLSVTPGQHLLIACQNGESGTLQLSLSPDTDTGVTPTDFRFTHLHPRLLRTGLLFTILGLATASSSVLLFTYHGDCATPLQNGDSTCKKSHSTLPAGIVLSSVGAALIGTGIGLLVKRQRLKKKAMRRFLEGEN